MRKALIFLAITAFFWVAAFPFFQNEQQVEEVGEIQKLALLSTSSEVLKGEMIAEWLGFSIENSTPLATYNLKEGVEKLLSIGVIKKAQLYKLAPSTLVVSYTLRDPFAKVGNWKNICLDQEGFLFPFAPFFTPKELPEIVFPARHDLDFGSLENKAAPELFSLAKRILLQKDLFHPYELCRVDLSRLDRDHPYGGEVILTLKNGERELYLRLWGEGFEERLLDFVQIIPKMDGVTGVDLRLPSRSIVF